MARPRKGDEKRHASFIGIKMPQDLRTEVERLAQSHGHSLTDEVLSALRYHVTRQAKAADKIKTTAKKSKKSKSTKAGAKNKKRRTKDKTNEVTSEAGFQTDLVALCDQAGR